MHSGAGVGVSPLPACSIAYWSACCNTSFDLLVEANSSLEQSLTQHLTLVLSFAILVCVSYLSVFY